MKFSQMPYERPDMEALKQQFTALTERLRAAESYEAARAVFVEKEKLEGHVETLETLVSIRHSIDTRDDFYRAEEEFWNAASPELEEYIQSWKLALFESPFRPQFAAEFGEHYFNKIAVSLRTFSPAIIESLQKENTLVMEYEKLLASAQIPFEDGVYTLSQLTPFKNDPDDGRRLRAWQAEGRWYEEQQEELDRYYDELVKLRDGMGRTLGGDGYTALGYDRMERIGYGKAEIEAFREAVRKYVVPVAAEIYERQARRLGKSYPLSFADAQLEFRSGNCRPVGSAEDILRAGQRFYDELSPETGAFFRTMLDNELLDVLSTEGKQAGGYCTGLFDYGVPFIFANFNGTQGDVEVVTHEAGHAFECYTNRDRLPIECIWPGMESCEVHSMSMEFFAEPWAESFFGSDAKKYLYSHLSGALTFIPYGTMVDHFQNIVYEQPGLTPAERHGVWKQLLGVYMPWLKLDGEIPFYADGEGWQRQHHIYSSPFYYIDYCLAQTVSLEFWSRIRRDLPDAWRTYMAYTVQGGSAAFPELLKNAGLDSPFEEETLRRVCAEAGDFLRSFDLGGIE